MPCPGCSHLDAEEIGHDGDLFALHDLGGHVRGAAEHGAGGEGAAGFATRANAVPGVLFATWIA